MEKPNPIILLTMLFCMFGVKALAHDIEVQNTDGKTIFYNYINEGKELEVTFRGSKYYEYNNEYIGTIVIPEEVTYLDQTRKVTSIGNEAFSYCTSLVTVSIGNAVTIIGSHAFQDCSSLTSVSIGNSVTNIGNEAFSYCTSLVTLSLGNSVTYIGESAFTGCESLSSVTFPSSVISIGSSAFEDCNGIISLTFPNSVTTIGGRAFMNCRGLTSVIIPNSVTTIESATFYGCRKLSSVTIPKSVTAIGEYAFYCENLSTIVSLIESPFRIEGKTSYEGVFAPKTFDNATLYVPVGTIDKYKATDGWKDFHLIKEGIGPDRLDFVRANAVQIQTNGNVLSISFVPKGTKISVYNLSGQKVGSVRAASESPEVITSLQVGDVGIVKVGNKSVKVVIE